MLDSAVLIEERAVLASEFAHYLGLLRSLGVSQVDRIPRLQLKEECIKMGLNLLSDMDSVTSPPVPTTPNPMGMLRELLGR